MCTQKLWKGLRQPGRPPAKVTEPNVPNARLGTWAAKVARFHRRDLVIAVNERSYLTVVFPLYPIAQFRHTFAGAVREVLEDLGVPEDCIHLELAVLEVAPLSGHTNRSLLGTLNDLEFHCRIELDYHSDLRKVQLNLNEIPHSNFKPYYVPITATLALFQASGGRQHRPLRH